MEIYTHTHKCVCVRKKGEVWILFHWWCPSNYTGWLEVVSDPTRFVAGSSSSTGKCYMILNLDLSLFHGCFCCWIFSCFLLSFGGDGRERFFFFLSFIVYIIVLFFPPSRWGRSTLELLVVLCFFFYYRDLIFDSELAELNWNRV